MQSQCDYDPVSSVTPFDVRRLLSSVGWGLLDLLVLLACTGWGETVSVRAKWAPDYRHNDDDGGGDAVVVVVVVVFCYANSKV